MLCYAMLYYILLYVISVIIVVIVVAVVAVVIVVIVVILVILLLITNNNRHNNNHDNKAQRETSALRAWVVVVVGLLDGHALAPWLRTNGVNTNGVAAKVMNCDRLGKKVRTIDS